MNFHSFQVPMVPPSVNNYVRHTRTGKHYVTKEARRFKDLVILLSGKKRVAGPEYAVEITVYLGKGQRGDL